MTAVPARCSIPQANPSSAAHLLESLVAERGYRPAQARTVQGSRELPQALWPICERAQQPTGAWAAWSHGGQVWLAAVELSLAHSRLQGRPVLQYLIDEGAGRQIAPGSLAEGQPGRWEPLALRAPPEGLVGTLPGAA